ncbi:MAG: alginate export family protein [Nitrospirota bacterium]|nr:alginate export family protein [Nitrospirota bacterium]
MKKYLAIAGAGLMMIGTAGLAAAATVDVGGEVRIKYENRESATFNNDNSDTLHGTHQRTRITVNAKVNDEISGKVSLQNIHIWGATGSTTSTAENTSGTTTGLNNTDVFESYIQINKVFGTPISARLGRQVLSYGDQRLVGGLDWADTGRRFDAVKFMYSSGDIALDVWGAKVDENSWTTNTIEGNDNDQDFFGAWLTYKGLKDNVIDVYALWLRDGGSNVASDSSANNGNDTGTALISGISYGDADGDGTVAGANKEGSVNIYTLGARIKGAVGGLDYTAELNYQTGNTFQDADVDAMAYAINVGYTLPVDMSPRLYVEYVHADGDDSSTDSDTETFNQLFPTGHAQLGYMDLVGFQNVEAWRFGASIKPTKALYIQADYWNFKLNEEKDYWYNAGGARTLGTVTTAQYANNSEDDLGSELDISVKYKYADNLSLEGGYSIFFPGDLGDTDLTGGGVRIYADDDDQTWAYAQIKLTF